MRVAIAMCCLAAGCLAGRAQPVSPGKPGTRTIVVSEGFWTELGDQEGHDVGVAFALTAGTAVRSGAFVGGRFAALPEFKIRIFDSEKREETGGVIDVGPVAGVAGGAGRLAGMVTAGPVLTWIDVSRDGEYASFWRAGIGADAGVTVRMFGNVCAGLGVTANVNSEHSVVGYMLRFQGSWRP